MNKMYKTITVVPLLLLIIMAGCKKSFLDKEIIGVNTQSGSLDNPENARAAINACYGYVNGGDWWTHLFPRLLMEASTDDGWGGNDYQDRPGELGVCDFTGLNANTSYVDAFYRGMHQGIRNCNFVINGMANVTTISDNLKNRYIAEAKFLRGFFYFELVKNYGDDVINTGFDPADATMFLARSPKADVYQQIYKDFQEAAAVLPEKVQYGSSDIGRATKGAALGFLAKAYLFNGDYANAESTAAQIISSGKYSLESRYSRIFEPENVNGIESLYEVNYVNAVGFYNGPEPGDVTNAASVDGGWGWFGLTSDLENAYVKEGDDVRRKATIIKAGEAVDNETPTRIYPKHLVGDKPGHTSWRYYRKYYIPLAKRVGPYGTYPFNDIKMRYADILLIHAEAAAFNGKTAEALTSMNQVRTRVGLLPKIGLTGDALKQAIWDERRLELAGEGTFRWDDIRRIKINGKALIALLMGPNGSFVKYNTTTNTDPVEKAGHREALNKGYYFKEGVNELWPIPASAINGNSAMVQNPGYN